MGLFDFGNLSPGDALTVSKLAAASYEDRDAPDGWQTLDSDDIAVDEGLFNGRWDDEAGLFRGGLLSGFQPAVRVMRSADTVAVSFKGTSNLAEVLLYTEILYSTLYVRNFTALLEGVADYVEDEDIEHVWITGHSLGASAVNEMEDIRETYIGGAFEDATYVGFASRELYTAGELLNVGFANDWVFKAVARAFGLSPTQIPFESATNNFVYYDDTFNSAAFAPWAPFTPYNAYSVHLIEFYIDGVERVLGSAFYDEMNRDSDVVVIATDQVVVDEPRNIWDRVDDPTFYLGRDEADRVEAGTDDDTLEGFGGDDQLDGNDGDDVILAGAGDDSIKGGRGEDELRGEAGNDDIRGLTDGRPLTGGWGRRRRT